MFFRSQSYFSRLAKIYPFLKLIDIYDHQSFIRVYVLDNVYVCILAHIVFYIALWWYGITVIRKMEKTNKEMLKYVEDNRTRLDDVMALSDKRAEFDEMVVKVREAQKLTGIEFEDEMRRLSTELINVTEKFAELEKIVKKYKSGGKSHGDSAEDVADGQSEFTDAARKGRTGSIQDFKILEPSYPPPPPQKPPPRKYGTFVSRPPGQRRPPPAAAAAAAPSPKIGFK